MISDTVKGTVGSALAFPIAGPAGIIGYTHGLASDPITGKDEAALNRDGDMAFIPGVTASRNMRRLRRQLKRKEGGSPRAISSSLGGISAMLLATAIGGAIGGFAPAESIDERVRNAGIGVASGAGLSGLAELGAVGLAALTPTRTKAEQTEAAEGRITPDLLIPGVGTYNVLKSFGRTIADEEEGITSANRA